MTKIDKKFTIDTVYGTENDEKTLIVKSGRGDIVRISHRAAKRAGIMELAKFIPYRIGCLCRDDGGVPYRPVWWCGFDAFTKEPKNFQRSPVDVPDELRYLFDPNVKQLLQ